MAEQARWADAEAPTGRSHLGIGRLWPPDFDGAVFDFDGTLALSGGIWLEVDKAFLASRGLTYDRQFTIELATLGFAEGARYVIERYGLDENPDDICREWNRIGAELYRDRVKLRPGVREYLARLADLGIPCALATTNAPGVLDAMKPRLDVDELFCTRVHGCEVARSKHFPDIYLEAASRIGVDPHRCVVFEDILSGLSAAMSVGMLGCAVKSNDPTQDEEALRDKADIWLEDWTLLL